MPPRYDVVLSFAGEDRLYVEAVATELVQLGVRVFYDKYEQADLWGKDLYQHLSVVYRSAKYCVVFVSKAYAAKLWTRHELKAAQARAFSESSEYILPARFDDSEVPGLLPTTAYVDLRNVLPETLASTIARKVNATRRVRKRASASLRKIYAGVEQLIAIYSLVAWRADTQEAPVVIEDSEYGGREFQITCPEIAWRDQSAARGGGLFECLSRMVIQRSPYDGDEFEGYQVTPNEDFWYTFRWTSLFGYDMMVTISPATTTYPELYALRDSIRDDSQRLARQELGDAHRHELSYPIYAVEVDGLAVAEAIAFLVATGYTTTYSNGSIRAKDECVVYIADKSPTTIPELHRVLQSVVRAMELPEVDLAKAVPHLEARWPSMGAVIADRISVELEHSPLLPMLKSSKDTTSQSSRARSKSKRKPGAA